MLQRLRRLPQQILRRNPFQGDITPRRVPVFAPGSGRPSLPFPHPWNFRDPIRILETFFWKSEHDDYGARHNRYLDVIGFGPVFVTRDPAVIAAISTQSGDRPGQFDRDTLPSTGIARATGPDSLLYANGSLWKRQKKIATPPFARTNLFQPEQFFAFEATFRETIAKRLAVLDSNLKSGEDGWFDVTLEPEIKTVMLEMLVNNFFGADVAYDVIRDRYVRALDDVIEYIISDTVLNRFGLPLRYTPPITRRIRRAREASAIFEELTDLVLATRRDSRGLWAQFKSDATDDQLRSNIRVFLAGALEATTSYASWAIAHLARSQSAQQRLAEEASEIDSYEPAVLKNARYLGYVLEETLRLSPSLYFHPRLATSDSWVDVDDDRRLMIPAGTHILLDVWHANRHEDHWGVEVTGFPADAFLPERFERLAEREAGAPRMHHFGFGHGPRFCPGRNLGQLEVALVVGAFAKLFEFEAFADDPGVRAGVSTKPADGVRIRIRRR